MTYFHEEAYLDALDEDREAAAVDDGGVRNDDDWEPCEHDHDEECYDYQGFDRCEHSHCFNCGGCECAGYCDDYQTYNLRSPETEGSTAAEIGEGT